MSKTNFRILLFPFGLLWGAVAATKRWMFRQGWKKSATFSVPTICVGNLSMGGTGKTPHVELITELLKENYELAILSRGYGRKSKGYVNAKELETLDCYLLGDEPTHYAQKFPSVEVAVCESRKLGIEQILTKKPNLDAIILDDAYQHLAVNYTYRILLTDFSKPYFNDFPFPAGTLREFRCASKYADIIVVTKCPLNLSTEQKEDFISKLKPKKHQRVFFSTITYSEIRSKKPEARSQKTEDGSFAANSKILLVTGVANPKPLVQYLSSRFCEIETISFPDHHQFTERDIHKINQLKAKLGGNNCIIITTEKDAMRLQNFNQIIDYYVIAIKIKFL